MFMAGIPETSTCYGINRMCSSGLQSVSTIADAIKAGTINVGIGGGVESMSNYDMQGAIDPNFLAEEVMSTEGNAQNCLVPMGVTSDNVAEKFGVTREVMDNFAAWSHEKALKMEDIRHTEITPYTTSVTDKDGNVTEVVVDKDDGPRAGTTAEKLSKLKPAF